MQQPARPSRRAVLGAVLLPLVAGCRRHGSPGTSGAPTASRSPDHTAELTRSALATALADEQRLLQAYDATLARHPALRSRLGSIRAEHAAHARVLLGAGAAPSPSTAPPPVAADAHAALAALVHEETRAAGARGAQCVSAPRRVAPLLGSLSAAEATHAALLQAAP